MQTNKEGAAKMHDYSVNARVNFKTLRYALFSFIFAYSIIGFKFGAEISVNTHKKN